MMKDLLLVAIGGGIGSVARFLCQRGMLAVAPGAFPSGTFIVNIVGGFLIGLFWGTILRVNENTDGWRLFLMTGFCGGFTTFSSFTFEGVGLIREQKIGLFVLYTGGSILLGLVATWAGIKLIRG